MEVIALNNTAIQKARENGKTYKAELRDHGDTHPQLLARSRSIVFKTKWTKRQIESAEILFKRYPSIEKAFNLAQALSHPFENKTNKAVARRKRAQWYPSGKGTMQVI
jgi:transposase